MRYHLGGAHAVTCTGRNDDLLTQSAAGLMWQRFALSKEGTGIGKPHHVACLGAEALFIGLVLSLFRLNIDKKKPKKA